MVRETKNRVGREEENQKTSMSESFVPVLTEITLKTDQMKEEREREGRERVTLIKVVTAWT